MTAFISPYILDRQAARDLIGDDFNEVFVDTDVEECIRRDPKGLYKKARAGEIKNFTGIDSPYEIPNKPNLLVDTKKESAREPADKVFSAISNKIK